MSTNKNNRDELLAIYRLDFYKKKKQWKLRREEEKGSEAPISSTTLNDDEESVEKEMAAKSDASNHSEDLSTQDQEQEYDNHHKSHLSSIQEHSIELDDKEISSLQEFECEKSQIIEQVDCTPSRMHMEEFPQMDVMSNQQYDEEYIESLNNLGPGLGYYVSSEVSLPGLDMWEWASDLGEGFQEFLRGAHLAPHSTEEDINIFSDKPAAVSVLDSSALTTLSYTQLRAAAEMHAGALSQLVAELEARDLHFSSDVSNACRSDSFKNCPLRNADISDFPEVSHKPSPMLGNYDMGNVYQFPCTSSWSESPHDFVAGSFLNRPPSPPGRGRGRLPRAEP